MTHFYTQQHRIIRHDIHTNPVTKSIIIKKLKEDSSSLMVVGVKVGGGEFVTALNTVDSVQSTNSQHWNMIQYGRFISFETLTDCS